jgi:hypothetical protein
MGKCEGGDGVAGGKWCGRCGHGHGTRSQNNAPTPAHPGSLHLTSLPCTSLHSPHGLMLGADVRRKPGFIGSDDFSGCLRGLLVRNRMAMPLTCARVRHDTYGRPATREQARDDNRQQPLLDYWSRIILNHSLVELPGALLIDGYSPYYHIT